MPSKSKVWVNQTNQWVNFTEVESKEKIKFTTRKCLCSSITQAEQPPTHPTLVLGYTSTLCLQYVLW
ncbi:hypothetical protein J6590_061366 [Homalodisca vitripennis]|nr:hypothetical protein J6590_061366 [Homalodisca vitripennis]